MKKEISRFTIGGTVAGPSLPAGVIAEALGTKIKIDMEHRELRVPTDRGVIPAIPGDTIIAYDDGSFGVVRKN